MKSGNTEKGKTPRATKRLQSATLLEGLALDLKRRRTGWNMSQRRLAEKAGTTQRTISMIEAGKANPSVKTLEAIAKALQLELQVGFRTKYRN